MVSGFLISPNDQLRILSGDAIPMRISSKVSGLAIGFAKLVSSFMVLCSIPLPRREGPGEGFQLFGSQCSGRFAIVDDAVQFDIETERAHFLDEHVEALWNAC